MLRARAFVRYCALRFAIGDHFVTSLANKRLEWESFVGPTLSSVRFASHLFRVVCIARNCAHSGTKRRKRYASRVVMAKTIATKNALMQQSIRILSIRVTGPS